MLPIRSIVGQTFAGMTLSLISRSHRRPGPAGAGSAWSGGPVPSLPTSAGYSHHLAGPVGYQAAFGCGTNWSVLPWSSSDPTW